MNIQHFKDYEAMSLAAAEMVYTSVQAKPDLLLCAATGNSPTGLYLQLQKCNSERSEDFSKMRVLKLDEWGGLSSEHPATCEHYLQQHLIQPLSISSSRYFGFNADTKNPEQECKRVQTELDANGPIDICILGIGVNGHLGLNEPAEQLTEHCHVAQLADTTLNHTMVAGLEAKPKYGMTLGMQAILASRHIILLISGAGKEKATQQLLSGEITNAYPATHLWKHPKVDCLVVG
ncbi:galactosamine-6-phosphate isomerase [Pontibacter anaerobius]|uniref:Galactosamine-6-phosphate isomerase n=1 Tax=Pontibacter anaerobius TaxID=2993940 RepID=A0ABT3RDF2_9BACT|nr:galactosamine-6-phosphate isomerase [Pontibacter anaerobius]MCX2739775.1 galactosamine-6-phosphate isomerase [Pontibacter anaerobius]